VGVGVGVGREGGFQDGYQVGGVRASHLQPQWGGAWRQMLSVLVSLTHSHPVID
jgi:hypothetical protein